MNQEEKLNKITETIIGAAINVHRALGPGLLESAYEACIVYDLVKTGLNIEQQKPLPIMYRNVKLECGYRIDILVENSVIVEIKSVETLLPIHLKLSNCRVRLLINFNVEALKNGIKRIVNNFPDTLRSPRTLR
jgi:GxxExxY protein